MCHKPQIQKSRICSTIIDVDQGFPMSYYMCCLIGYMLCYSIFFRGYPYICVKLWMQKYYKCGQNCRCTSAIYAACKMILIRAFQRHLVYGIIWTICKVIAYSLKGMLKLHLYKYCIHTANHLYKSPIYVVLHVWPFIRVFQQYIICGIVLAISDVMASSFKGSVINCDSRTSTAHDCGKVI